MKVTKTLIENRLKNALRRLYFHDSELIVNDVHERSITHRLAVHLGTVFYEWDVDVDVEYNRNAGDVKRINNVTMDLLSQISDMQEVVFGGKTVYPVIIIHKRNTNKNLLRVACLSPPEVCRKALRREISAGLFFFIFISWDACLSRPEDCRRLLETESRSLALCFLFPIRIKHGLKHILYF
ncbi:hypothetical protein [Caldifermentibacillus hisashii]|uniref:hypothetical protein n=1 Tax=Caldifermentibacillus hisashii TaxID=996558 RepID=UPI00310108CB